MSMLKYCPSKIQKKYYYANYYANHSTNAHFYALFHMRIILSNGELS